MAAQGPIFQIPQDILDNHNCDLPALPAFFEKLFKDIPNELLNKIFENCGRQHTECRTLVLLSLTSKSMADAILNRNHDLLQGAFVNEAAQHQLTDHAAWCLHWRVPCNSVLDCGHILCLYRNSRIKKWALAVKAAAGHPHPIQPINQANAPLPTIQASQAQAGQPSVGQISQPLTAQPGQVSQALASQASTAQPTPTFNSFWLVGDPGDPALAPPQKPPIHAPPPPQPCQHPKFHYVHHGGRCQMCSAIMPSFMFECRNNGCRLRACLRCKKYHLSQIGY